jgi:filamentous hemagglutinin
MSQDALDYQSILPGAVTDVKTRKLIAPGLRYDNPNPRGKNYILFDGVDLYDATTLIDRKLGIARSRKQEDTFRRWAAGLRQNPGIKIRIEVPNQRVSQEIRDFLRKIQVEEISNGRIQIVEVPID